MSKRTLFTSAATFLVVVVVVMLSVPAAKSQVESTRCGNYMASIGYAARLWAHDHDGRLPSTLRSMSNEVITPTILVCPGDHSRTPAASWNVFSPADSSYEIVTPDLKDGDTNGVFLRCRIHGHLGYADATVFDGVSRRTKIP